MMRHVALILALVMSIHVLGCTTTSVYEPEHLAHNDAKLITVHTKDGRRIQFGHGDYAVKGGVRDSVTGTGRIVTNSVNNATAHWEGTIALDDIELVSVTEMNPLGYAGIAGLVAGGMLVILLVYVGTTKWY